MNIGQMSRTACLAIALSVPSIAALAAGPITYAHTDKATILGHKIQIMHEMALNIDCTVAGSGTFQIVAQPAHGRLSEVKTNFFPAFRAPNPRVKCNSRKEPGELMYYTPNQGYVGHDFVEARIGYYDGHIDDVKVDIDVK